MKKTVIAFIVIVMVLSAAIPVSASHVDPCNENHTFTETTPASPLVGDFSLDPQLNVEYWKKAGETIVVTVTVNDVSSGIKSVGGVGLQFRIQYNPNAVTLVEEENEDRLITAPGGNTSASREDWLDETDVSNIKDSKTGNNVLTFMAFSSSGFKGDTKYAIKESGEFSIAFKFTVNSGYTGDIKFKTSDVSITDNNAKERVSAGFARNVKSYDGLLANAGLQGNWSVIESASCKNEGLAMLRCQKCGELAGIKVIPKEDHVEGEWEEITEKTCTVDGKWEKHCTGCEKLLDTKTEKAEGHNFGEWEEHKAATMLNGGVERRYCENCEKYESRNTEKLPFDGIKGDVNRDGRLTVEDADIIRLMFTGKKGYDAMDILYADGNVNNKLDLGDYIGALRGAE